eukprot:gene31051-40389_t
MPSSFNDPPVKSDRSHARIIQINGSSSHFTVLFCRELQVNQESRSERLVTLLQRSFKAVESDDCGYIPVLNTIVESSSSADDDVAGINTIRTILGDAVDGEIIIWGNFWGISKLMSGTVSLDDLINAADSALIASLTAEEPTVTPLLQAPFISTPPVSGSRKRHPSPSPTNRAHNANNSYHDDFQFSYGNNLGSSAMPAAASSTGGWQTPTLRDSKEWSSSTAMDVASSSNTSYWHSQPNLATKAAADSSVMDLTTDDAESFTLYHFNGLQSVSSRSLKLTGFKLHLRSVDDAVGQFITFAGGEGGGSIGGNICPIEEVLRTRWPGCRVDWLGQGAP